MESLKSTLVIPLNSCFVVAGGHPHHLQAVQHERHGRRLHPLRGHCRLHQDVQQQGEEFWFPIGNFTGSGGEFP